MMDSGRLREERQPVALPCCSGEGGQQHYLLNESQYRKHYEPQQGTARRTEGGKEGRKGREGRKEG